MKKIAVIGAGPMGMVAAWELLKQGHQVELFEQDDRLGGMSASFDFGGLPIERYYHFICKSDRPLFDLLAELGLSKKLRWRHTAMGYYYHGKLYRWGDPMALFAFPHLSLISKFRYALHILYCKYVFRAKALDRLPATSWLKRWLGETGYAILWQRLLELKYYEYTPVISAAWIAARIKRIAESRDSLWAESLGYLQGGSQALITRLGEDIGKRGGIIHLSARVERVNIKQGKLVSLTVNGQAEAFDTVVSTIPLPYLLPLAPDLPADEREKIAAITNISVACVILKLTRSFSGNFWTNICDPTIDMPGLIEYSNLCPMADTIVYAPYYLPPSHAKFRYSDAQFLAEVISYMKRINPAFDEGWIKASHVSRYRYAQTVCSTNFFSALPPMQSAADGLFMADTAYYYPEDRSISESARIGKILAAMAGTGTST